MAKTSSQWQTDQLTRTYLQGVRRAIPLAQDQIDILLTIVRAWCPAPQKVVDLGCGDGILGRAIQAEHPEAQIWFVDFSQPMLDAARQKLTLKGQATLVLADLAKATWQNQLEGIGPIDVVISGFGIHHLTHSRKQALYGEIHALLAPDGIFLNLDHVSSPTPAVEELFRTHFVDHLYAYHQRQGSKRTRKDISEAYYARQDKEENILAPVQTQCQWLREIGFADVDCYFKAFELALFGGRKMHSG